MVLLFIGEILVTVCMIGVIVGTVTLIFNFLPQSQLHPVHLELANWFGGVAVIFKLTLGAYIGFVSCAAYIWCLKFSWGIV